MKRFLLSAALLASLAATSCRTFIPMDPMTFKVSPEMMPNAPNRPTPSLTSEQIISETTETPN